MVQPSKFPVYIILEKDSILSYFCGEDIEKFLVKPDVEQLKMIFAS